MDEFTDKVAVVTGAASGIGLGMAKRFLSAGMKVVMSDIERPALEAAVAELSEGSRVLAVETDVSQGEQVEALRARTLEHFGGVHVVCNNAGVSGGGRCWETSEKTWQWVLGVNLWGVIHGVRVFGPDLVEQDEGHIVNTASMAGLMTFPGLGAYNVSKQGVVALSETLGLELQAKGSRVGVSVLCPAAVNTKIHQAARNRPEQWSDHGRKLSAAERAKRADFEERWGAALAEGLAPEQVAQQVFDAIVERRLYVITHPEMMPFFQQRAEAILADTGVTLPTQPKP